MHADSAELAIQQLVFLVREAESGGNLDRDDIDRLLKDAIDVIVQYKRTDGRFRATDIKFRG